MNFLLRKINKNDLNYFLKIKNNNNVLKYLGNPKNINNKEITDWFYNIFNENNTDRFLIINQADINNIYGDICIGDIDYNNLSCSLHIKILPEYWGKNIGSIVIDRIILYCKEVLKLNYIHISININNLRSLNLFKRFNIRFIELKNDFNYYLIDL
jgi:RimJ/RimL family protein N-acetyltransferase